jgi:hypothetical protein
VVWLHWPGGRRVAYCRRRVGAAAFHVACVVVLRSSDLNGILTPAQIGQAIDEVSAWPLRVTKVRGLQGPEVSGSWRRCPG